MSEYPDRIPQSVWLNIQMSIARFYGGINIKEQMYLIDEKTQALVRKGSLSKKKKEKK
jgi:hypothetical protein